MMMVVNIYTTIFRDKSNPTKLSERISELNFLEEKKGGRNCAK